MEYNQDNQEQINEFLIPLVIYGLVKITSTISKYSGILLTILAGATLYIAQKLIRSLIGHINQARFEKKTKDIFIDHLNLMNEFSNSAETLGIEKSGFVTLDNINSDTLKCIKNKDHIEALNCTINIFKESHFYLLDIFLQSMYFSEHDLSKLKRLSQLKTYSSGDSNIDSYVLSYYGLVKNFFLLILELRKSNKYIIINPYMVEQEFNKKFIELNSQYKEILSNAGE